MEGRLGQTTPAHILAASPTIWKDLVEKLHVHRVEASSFEGTGALGAVDISTYSTSMQEPAYSLPLCEIDIWIGDKVTEAGVIDPGSQIIMIRDDLAREVGATINTSCVLQMEGANGATNRTLGCAEFLPMCAGDMVFKVHVHVVECAPFRLLLGCPFQHALLCRMEDLVSGDVKVSISDPANPALRVTLPSRARKVQAATFRILTVSCQSHPHSQQSLPPFLFQSHPHSSPLLSQPQFIPSLPNMSISPSNTILTPIENPVYTSIDNISQCIPSSSKCDPISPSITYIPLSLFISISAPPARLYPSPINSADMSVQAYKKVVKKVRPVPTSLPEDFRTVWCIPSDPLLTLPDLPTCPPYFSPGERLTQECLNGLELNRGEFLWLEELKLLLSLVRDTDSKSYAQVLSWGYRRLTSSTCLKGKGIRRAQPQRLMTGSGK